MSEVIHVQSGINTVDIPCAVETTVGALLSSQAARARLMIGDNVSYEVGGIPVDSSTVIAPGSTVTLRQKANTKG